ncbi:hypothetical protein ACS0TY_016461 [Phlomoides rotata]
MYIDNKHYKHFALTMLFFKECPHPDDTQRTELGHRLGMEPLQVKFWFQNKRTQMKTQYEHTENNKLRAENEKLQAENLRFKEVLDNAYCLHCGVPTPVTKSFSPEHEQLRLENSRLRKEIDHISSVSTKSVGKTIPTSMETTSSTSHLHSGNFKAIYEDLWSSLNNGGQNERHRPVVDIAMSAMEELMRVAQLGEPLWVPSIDRNSFVLNEDEYFRSFSRIFRQKTNGFKFEASRESVFVPTRAANVVEILMDTEQWLNIFSGVVSRATNVQVISAGLGGTYNEAALLVNAEFQVPSPLVQTRESIFLRYCKQHYDGIWAVVDVSLDNLLVTSSVTCRRRPSGCLIQDTPDGHSKVIWLEHVEVADGGIHSIYKPLITSGLAFGARRWVAILEGYCERLVRTYSIGVPTENGGVNQVCKRSMIKLAERMVTRFCCGVSSSIVNTWTNLSGNGNENVKFMTRTNVDDPTMPFGVLLTIATSFWLPVPPKRVFDFLCDNNTRKEWDMLLNGGDIEEMAHIVSGREEFNRVKLCQLKGSDSSSSQTMIMQESRSDPTASYIVYAPIDVVCVNKVLGGEDPSNIPLLPSGFAILPDGPTGRGLGRGMSVQTDTGGSLLTIALQILIDSTPSSNLSIESFSAASKLMRSSSDKIKLALIPSS